MKILEKIGKGHSYAIMWYLIKMLEKLGKGHSYAIRWLIMKFDLNLAKDILMLLGDNL